MQLTLRQPLKLRLKQDMDTRFLLDIVTRVCNRISHLFPLIKEGDNVQVIFPVTKEEDSRLPEAIDLIKEKFNIDVTINRIYLQDETGKRAWDYRCKILWLKKHRVDFLRHYEPAYVNNMYKTFMFMALKRSIGFYHKLKTLYINPSKENELIIFN